ncbi:MAG: hybrid sensor histidine kinase/response regulator, partial [Anaerolineales bacterium]|nr:hybrid sensor histidine kinase/response regulator [Anaerolineales bacterium]
MDRHEEFKRTLLATFKGELDDHLGTLNRELLALERNPPQDEQEAILEEVFRAAHSIKGAARAVDLGNISMLAHRLEDVFSALRRGDLSPSSSLFDALFPFVDALRENMAAHLRGEPIPMENHQQMLDTLEAVMQGKEEIDSVQQDTPKPQAPTETVSQENETRPVVQEEQPGYAPKLTGETIRVATTKLDILMDGIGELLVSRMRTEQRLAEIRALQANLTQWQKNWRQVRSHYNRIKGRSATDTAATPWGHQDITPVLEFLANNEEQLADLDKDINRLGYRFASDYGHLSLLTDDLQEGVRRVRMLPIASLFDLFPRMVRDLTRQRRKKIVLHLEGADTEVDRQVLEAIKDPLTHLLRNAVDHGIENPDVREAAGKPRQGNITLRAAQKGNTIVIEIRDDGAGIDVEAVRRAAVGRGLMSEAEAANLSERETIDLIFRSGLSTHHQVTDISGRGVGMDVVRQNLELLQGVVTVDTSTGQGTTFTLTLPLTMATNHVLLVEVADQIVAVPTTTVERMMLVSPASLGSIEGKPAIRTQDQPLPLLSLARVLELHGEEKPLAPNQKIPVIVVGVVEKRVAFRVDAFQGTQEVVIKNLGSQLKRVRNVAGATILGSGQVVMILNIADLIQSAQLAPGTKTLVPVEVSEISRRRVLVVDDSITTRTLEKNILENAGYDVLVAADGVEAWGLVQGERFDAIVADIDMPRMDGFKLTEKVKADDLYAELPLVLVTSLESPEDRIRGMEAGADAYITKGAFDQKNLLET